MVEIPDHDTYQMARVDAVHCPNCRSEAVKRGAVASDMTEFDFGCYDCRTLFDEDDAE